MSSDEGEPSNFELIRDTLLRLDPETCAQTIEAMKVIRTLPTPVAVRILANAARDSALRSRSLMMMPG